MKEWQFEFRTTAFRDDAEAAAQRVNTEVGGYGLAVWLSNELNTLSISASKPWYEDHGADFSIDHDGKRFLVVCCVTENGDADRDAIVAIDRRGSLWDKLFRRNTMTTKEPVADTVRQLLEEHTGVTGLHSTVID